MNANPTCNTQSRGFLLHTAACSEVCVVPPGQCRAACIHRALHISKGRTQRWHPATGLGPSHVVVHSNPSFPGWSVIWEMPARPWPCKQPLGSAFSELIRNTVCFQELLKSSYFPYDQPWKIFLFPEWHNIPVLTLSKKVPPHTVTRMKHCYDWSPFSCSPINSGPKQEPFELSWATTGCDQHLPLRGMPLRASKPSGLLYLEDRWNTAYPGLIPSLLKAQSFTCLEM